METTATYTAFAGERRLATGSKLEVALAMKAASQRGDAPTILAFEDQTGRQVDFDLRGTDKEIAARLEPSAPEAKRLAGRPKLGVVAREVTLLPRHWEWLAAQPGGASVTLRKLVTAARNGEGGKGAVRQAQQAVDGFMSATLGNQPGYEEAARALYAGDRVRFLALTEAWPVDLRDHARRLAAPALPESAA
ncbi:MAG TPA: DUF2239 family protein [Alphaproteobacteria bacterium]|jgi:hypothetical protein